MVGGMGVPGRTYSQSLAAGVVAPAAQAQAATAATKTMVHGTLSACQAPPLAGERKARATSLEGAARAAARMLGTSAARLSVVASALTPREGLPRQEYEVVALAPLGGGRHVTCHDDPFPYAVYRCHMEKEASTEAYVLTLRGHQLHHGMSGGSTVDMVAVCHLGTSNWSPAHPAFETLNLRPSGAPVCHFMPYADLLFTEKAATPKSTVHDRHAIYCLQIFQSKHSMF